MKIAYVVRNGFYPAFNGERVKTASLSTALAHCGDLSVLDLGRSDYPKIACPDGEIFDLPYGGQARIYSMLVHGRSAAVRRDAAQGKRLSRLPLARRSAAKRLIAELAPDVLVVDHPLLAPLALQSAAKLKIVHAHNVESQLAASLAQTKGGLRQSLKVWRLRRVEKKAMPALSQVWAVSESDAQQFRALGAAQVLVTPNIIPDSAFAATQSPGQIGHAAFFGWLAYPPNAEAVEYLLNLAERCDWLTRLTLIGRGLPARLEARIKGNPKLRYLGYVENLTDALSEAAAVLIPLQHGAGTKLKVIEALALGKVLVTTPIGAEGLDLAQASHAFVKPLGADFDACAQEVLCNPAAHQAMARIGQNHARARFSQVALNQAVAEALSTI